VEDSAALTGELFAAIVASDVERARRAVAAGASPTSSALCRACSLGAQALVLRMLDAGADVNAMLDATLAASRCSTGRGESRQRLVAALLEEWRR
jgi:hypothetical protein